MEKNSLLVKRAALTVADGVVFHTVSRSDVRAINRTEYFFTTPDKVWSYEHTLDEFGRPRGVWMSTPNTERWVASRHITKDFRDPHPVWGEMILLFTV